MDNEQYLNEVRKALDRDTTRLGDVWRLTNEDKTPSEIGKELNPDGKYTYVYSYQKYIQVITDEELPETTSTRVANDWRKILQSFLRRHKDAFSPDPTIKELERRIEECDRRATDPQALEEENEEVEKETVRALESGTPGIYVYSYPHYLRHPVKPDKDDTTDDRTYLKIGMSEDDVLKRVGQQKTGMPEPPQILQIWLVENDSDIEKFEKKIQDHLRMIGHGGPNKRREWFLTNEQSVESTANLLGLTLYDHKNPKTDD